MLEQIIAKIEILVREKFSGNEGSHDWYHIDRVRWLALHIADNEGGNRLVVELAALLHDMNDWKFRTSNSDNNQIDTWLKIVNTPPRLIAQVNVVVEEVSFKGAGVTTPCSSIESMIVQDADRLDAMGAVGIARAFAYGGSKNRPLYNPDENQSLHRSFKEYQKNSSSSILHFHEKLLLLKDRMNTQTARHMAIARHETMLKFLDDFFDEWNLKI